MMKWFLLLKIYSKRCLLFLFIFACASGIAQLQETTNHNNYAKLKKSVASGWNTWSTYSILSHILLPEAYAVHIQLFNSANNNLLDSALIAKQGSDSSMIEHITPGMRSYDGSYTDLTIRWQGLSFRIQTASKGKTLFMQITPVNPNEHGKIRLKPEVLWGKQGSVKIDNSILSFHGNKKNISLYVHSNTLDNKLAVENESVELSARDTVFCTTHQGLSAAQIASEIENARKLLMQEKEQHLSYADLYESMQQVLAWNTKYEPTQDRVISLVSQVWSRTWNGYMLPVWDTYFAAYMLSFDNKELAYSNALAVTKAITSNGFIPNVSTGFGKTEDRSQPPVGSFVIKELYRKYHDKWLLHETFNELLSWNRWWDKNRSIDGFLCWGSSLYDTSTSNQQLAYGVHALQGALYESGLDNSSMYDDAYFDKERNVMLLADVGLMSFYVLDCKSLAEIAIEIGRPEVAAELNKRANVYAANTQKLWNDKSGIFQNKHINSGIFSEHLSPTLFYPLLAGIATQQQAQRMVQEHFYNPDEFWGEYIMPSTARNEEAFKDNHYFRGRIWPPMNFLVYLGLRKYNIGSAASDMAEKSKQLLLKTWHLKQDVYENYNATSGEGFDVGSSQRSYYWGALLGFISFIENGLVEAPEKQIASPKNNKRSNR